SNQKVVEELKRALIECKKEADDMYMQTSNLWEKLCVSKSFSVRKKLLLRRPSKKLKRKGMPWLW
ncbi:hypothetical protein A2U01_0119261, partial [Trifolium medium]|nr:hypothetical protein [Trifolium medium]